MKTLEIDPKLIILLTIYRKNGATINEIISETGLGKSTVYYNVYKMMTKGVIEQRSGEIVLTEKGCQIIKQIRKMIEG